MGNVTHTIKIALAKLGIGVIRQDQLVKIRRQARISSARLSILQARIDLLATIPAVHAGQLAAVLPNAQSQVGQDVFVLSELELKQGGYFVEFGATNGKYLSNTYLLEKHFGWSGIVAEPAKIWHSALRQNRLCNIDEMCVWDRSGETLQFREVAMPELSTVEHLSTTDYLNKQRRSGRVYQVRTISLDDLLDKYDAPKVIDYLSIDTEGSELQILRHFDFERHSFRIITCEHNYTSAREEIFALLTSKGYSRKYESLSKWDDWYVRDIP